MHIQIDIDIDIDIYSQKDSQDQSRILLAWSSGSLYYGNRTHPLKITVLKGATFGARLMDEWLKTLIASTWDQPQTSKHS